jgi:hypothetical protein
MAVAGGDFDRDGVDDLAIGAPGNDVGRPQCGQRHRGDGLGHGLTHREYTFT